MKLSSLLGSHLKDPAIVEILEHYEADVVYDFDRLVEGQPDVYWAACRPGGFLLKFDEDQVLTTVFLYVRGDDEYSPCSPVDCFGVQGFDSVEDAGFFAKKKGLDAVSRHLGPNGPKWIRIDMGDYSAHYEFGDAGLDMVTLMLARAVPR
ncbi:MAG: hypothetical protein QNJ00_17885 [Woeseiaceae bacterium]|nr:hypothetical protein [Woeseiaceae bacterium]